MTKTTSGWDACRLGLSIGTLIFMASGRAHAIPLPDSSVCNLTGNCLKIRNNANGTAILGEAAGSGIGVYGNSATASGYGVIGNSGASGTGVLASSASGNGAFATTGGTTVTASTGSCTATSGSCVGVRGTVRPETAGTAVVGDAGNSGSAWAGYFVGDVSAVDYYNNSDARLKKNIQNLSHATESILKLRPVTYQWKRDERGGAQQIGLIAQEVQTVFPNAVRADTTSGMLSVNYTSMVPVLIKSVQEQQATIHRLESRIEALNRERTPTLQSSLMHPASLLGGLALIPLAFVRALRRRKAS
jgi:hypothetical protein